MNIRTRRYLAIFVTCAATLALYGTAAWRVEQLRNLPREFASCNYERCIPTTRPSTPFASEERQASLS